MSEIILPIITFVLAIIGLISVVNRAFAWVGNIKDDGPPWIANPLNRLEAFFYRLRTGDHETDTEAEWKSRAQGPFLVRYDPTKGYGPDDQPWVKIKKIVVERDFDRQQVLLALEYLHDRDIDTDYIAVNTLVHMYEHPEIVVIGE